MAGQGEFTPTSHDEYKYIEQGTLTLDHGGVVENVTRVFLYQFKDEAIQIYYADGPDNGKLFQTLTFKNDSEASAEHLCGKDLYKSHYKFEFPESFTITHDVKGPKKDYVSETVFRRLNNL